MAGILEENKMDKEKYEEISDMAKYWHKENKMLAENNDKLQVCDILYEGRIEIVEIERIIFAYEMLVLEKLSQ